MYSVPDLENSLGTLKQECEGTGIDYMGTGGNGHVKRHVRSLLYSNI